MVARNSPGDSLIFGILSLENRCVESNIPNNVRNGDTFVLTDADEAGNLRWHQIFHAQSGEINPPNLG